MLLTKTPSQSPRLWPSKVQKLTPFTEMVATWPSLESEEYLRILAARYTFASLWGCFLVSLPKGLSIS